MMHNVVFGQRKSCWEVFKEGENVAESNLNILRIFSRLSRCPFASQLLLCYAVVALQAPIYILQWMGLLLRGMGER